MSYTYDPFGKVTANGSVMNPFQYVGQYGHYYDAETGYDFIKIRYYDSLTDRFTTPDTFPGWLENPISQNAYLYAHGNPVNYVDLDGHSIGGWLYDNVVKPVENFVDTYIVQPLDKYVIQPTKQYVIEPLYNNVVKPVYNASKKAYNTVVKPKVDYVNKNIVQPLKKTAQQLFEETKTVITQKNEEIKHKTQNVIDGLSKVYNDGKKKAEDLIKQGYTELAQTAKNLLNTPAGQVVKDLGKIVGGTVEMAVAVSPVGAIFGGKLLSDGYKNFSEGMNTKTGKVLLSTVQTVGGAIETGIGAAMIAGAGWTGIGAVVGATLIGFGVNNMIEGGTSLYNQATNQGDTGLNPLREYVFKPVFGEKAGGIIYNLTDLVVGLGGPAVTRIKDLPKLVEGAKGLVTTDIPQLINGAKEFVTTGFKSMVEGVKNYPIMQREVAFAGGPAGREVQTLGDAFSDLKNGARDFYNWVVGKSDDAGEVASNAGKISTEETNVLITEQQLQTLANKANQAVEGQGTVPGTLKHTEFANQVKGLNNPLLQTEVSYKNGQIVSYGTKGGVRLDVVEYNSDGTIKTVYDLKTGKAGLTDSRIEQIQSNLPNIAPVIEIRPNR